MLIAPPVGAEHDREADREALRGVDSGLAVENQGDTRPSLDPGTTIFDVLSSASSHQCASSPLLEGLGVATYSERRAVDLAVLCH